MKLRSRFLPLAVASALALTACATPDEDADVSAGGVASEGAQTDNEASETEVETTETESEAEATDTESEPTDNTESEEAAGAVELGVTSTDVGDHLADAEGNTLYASTGDEDGVSNCGPECARIWQPVEGEATVSGDLDESLLGTVDREDGTTQVTYNGAPLYRFVADQAGEARGHGVNGTWWAVGADGELIREGGLQEDATADDPSENTTDDSEGDEGDA